jgi:hypothetical protein
VSNNVGEKISKTPFASMAYAFGALGGRTHLLRFQRVTAILYSIRCISNPKVPLKRCRFEIIPKATSARANLSEDSPACTERPTDRG